MCAILPHTHIFCMINNSLSALLNSMDLEFYRGSAVIEGEEQDVFKFAAVIAAHSIQGSSARLEFEL